MLSSTVAGAVCTYDAKNHPGAFLFQSNVMDKTISGSERQCCKINSIRQQPLQQQLHPSEFFVSSSLHLKRGSVEDDNYIMVPIDNTSIMANMEKEVRASAQATLDLKRVTEALTDANSGVCYEPSSSMTVLNNSSDPNFSPDVSPPSQWKIAFSAGLAASLVSFLLLHQPLLSFALFLATTIVAARDPIDEGSTLIDGEDNVAGPLARLIGRATLQSIEESTPKVRAMTKAAVTGSAEIDFLRGRIQELEVENASLALWVERRRYVDENVGGVTLDQLKDSARKEGLAVGGTKAQLMMRLAEAGCFGPDRFLDGLL